MPRSRTGPGRRKLLAAATVYGVLWGLTALRGTFVAEESVSIHCTGSRDTPRVEQLGEETRAPWIRLSSSSLAPFLVRVEYDHVLGPLWGAGGTVFVLWLPGRTFVLGERLRWIS